LQQSQLPGSPGKPGDIAPCAEMHHPRTGLPVLFSLIFLLN